MTQTVIHYSKVYSFLMGKHGLFNTNSVHHAGYEVGSVSCVFVCILTSAVSELTSYISRTDTISFIKLMVVRRSRGSIDDVAVDDLDSGVAVALTNSSVTMATCLTTS